MKSQFSFPVIIVLLIYLSGCSREEKIKEKPDNIIVGRADTALFKSIMADFPEKKNNMTSHSGLFSDTIQKRIVLKTESKVYLTYISEGAFFDNSFGWYSYDSTKTVSKADVKLNILFPNVSKNILKEGNMLQVGDGAFPAGTVLGFFLIVRGWENGAVHFDRETFFTDVDFNPNHQQQHILFQEKSLPDLVLAFEDLSVADTSDYDFNDIIFTVTDNTENKEPINFDLRHVARQ
jgi:hypothetical protein